jgi:hypothetical protein
MVEPAGTLNHSAISASGPACVPDIDQCYVVLRRIRRLKLRHTVKERIDIFVVRNFA